MESSEKNEMLEKRLKDALAQIGGVCPFFDTDINKWAFDHPDYPMESTGDTREEVALHYTEQLKEFIKQSSDERPTCVSNEREAVWGGVRKLFTLEERRQIEKYIAEGLSSKKISEKLNRSYSGIKTEIRRFGGRDNYRADIAYQRHIDRMERRGQGRLTLSPDELNKLNASLAEGKPLSVVADELNTTPASLSFFVGHYLIPQILNRLEKLETHINRLTGTRGDSSGESDEQMDEKINHGYRMCGRGGDTDREHVNFHPPWLRRCES